MAFLGDDAKRELTTERVRGGRRAALIAGVAAVAVIGTLIWKPWDNDSRAPAASLPASTAPAIAVASRAPVATQPVTSASTPQPTEQPATGTPPPLGQITWYRPAGTPSVTCVYEAITKRQFKLRAMEVHGPSLTASADVSANNLASVQFQSLIEVNHLNTVFNAEWQSAAQSEIGVFPMQPHDQFTVPAALVDVVVGALDHNTVYRAVIAVRWLDADGNQLLDQRTVATSYGPPRDASDGCPGYTTKAALK